MPKVTKKKKEKNADFTKAKLKLGKGKKQASNATDTSFKARSIALPGQNNLNRALADISEPVTNGGLTLDEVILRFRHPNGGVRKESLGGLKDILCVGISRDVGKVVRALGGLVSDDDAGVRKALLGFMSWYIPNIPEAILSPHLPLLLLQTSSALSHIFPEIRLDASKLVSLLLTHIPKHVTGSWPSPSASSSKTTLDSGNNILEGLRLAVGLGGEAGQNTSMGKLGLAGRLTGLETLLGFVRAAQGDDSLSDAFAGWADGLGRHRRSGRKRKGKEVVVTPDVIMPLGTVIGEGDWGVQMECWEIGRLDTRDLSKADASDGVLSELYLQLSPLLLSTFLEAAPNAFSPASGPASSLETPIGLCLATANLTLALTRPILQKSAKNEIRSSVSDFLRRMAPYFPFRNTNAPSPTGLTPSLELNMVYSNLAILLAPPIPTLGLYKVGKKEIEWRERVKAIEEVWKGMREVQTKKKGKERSDGWAIKEVSEWVLECLTPSKDALAPSLTSTTYAALLPIIWSLLAQPPSIPTSDDDIPSTIGQAFIHHLLRQNSSSPIRALGDGFMINLLNVHEQKYPLYPFYIPPKSPVRALIVQWIESVPKTLWEIGARDEKATIGLLEMLLDIALRGQEAHTPPYSSLSNISFQALATKIAIWFHLVHPFKGSTLGPWTKLQNYETRKLGLDVALSWEAYDSPAGALGNAVAAAVRSRGGADEAYWTSRVR